MSLNPNQFKLFYSGQELQDSITRSWDIDEDEGDTGLESMWNRKLEESMAHPRSGQHGAGVYDSIREEGFRPHVRLGVHWGDQPGTDTPDLHIEEGHHRLASAAALERETGQPQWINVDNYDRGLSFRLNRGLPNRVPEVPGLRLGGKIGSPRPVGPQAPTKPPLSSATKANVFKWLGE
jgi:hypothetical protein